MKKDTTGKKGKIGGDSAKSKMAKGGKPGKGQKGGNMSAVAEKAAHPYNAATVNGQGGSKKKRQTGIAGGAKMLKNIKALGSDPII